jgi:hypothetical protein
VGDATWPRDRDQTVGRGHLASHHILVEARHALDLIAVALDSLRRPPMLTGGMTMGTTGANDHLLFTNL